MKFRTIGSAWLVGSLLAAIAVPFVGCAKKERSAQPQLPLSRSVTPDSRPLEAPVVSGNFELLDASQTGIDFVYQMAPDGEAPSAETAFAGGGGVAIGDYDGDGWEDVYLTRPHGGGRLYRNLGGWKFEDATETSGLGGDSAWGAGTSFADIDNDGDLDLYVCGYATPNRMFINQGDGTFQERARELGLAIEGASVMMSFADYDLDGDLDGFLIRNRYHLDSQGRPFPKDGEARLEREPFTGEIRMGEEWAEQFAFVINPQTGSPQLFRAGQSNQLFRNDGSRGFTEVGEQAGVADTDLTLSATWWDFDADGLPDLYVSSDFYGPDHLYRNRGDGSFEDLAPKLLPHTPWFSMGADFADINNDGLMDFFATDMAGSTHYKSKMGMGSMDDKGWFLETGEPRQYMRNALYLNSGAGRFMEIAHQAGVAASDWTWAPKFADLDCDGWVDLFITNGMTADLVNSDVAAGLVDPSTASAPKRDANMAFRNRGDLSFENVGTAWGLGIESVSFGAALGDLDNDGDPDLVVNEWQAPCSVFRNDLTGASRVSVRLDGAGTKNHPIGAEVRLSAGGLTQVRQLHLAHGFMSSDSPVVLFGLGDASRIDRIEVRWPGGLEQVAEDLAPDREYTFVAQASRGAEPRTSPARGQAMFEIAQIDARIRHRENDFDDFAVQPLLPNRLSIEGPPLATGDLNGDGFEDIVIGGAAGQITGVWLRSETGFDPARADAFRSARASEDTALELFDVDGDGDLDLYVVSGGYEFEVEAAELADRLYLNDGRGGFSLAAGGVLPEARESGGCVCASDYDGDGDLDLFVGGRQVPGRYPEIPRSRLLRNDSSASAVKFTDQTESDASGLSAVGLATAALWSDFDGDGDADLIVACEWGPVELFRNDGGKLVEATEAAGLADRSGWWRGLAAADFDGDGDMDLAAGNFGLNSKYHPRPEAPVSIYYADFDGGGTAQIVEAAIKGGRLLPIRGKSCSQAAIPSLRDKFPTFHQFASSALQEIYTEQKLGMALRLEADELRSGLFLNQGDGRFEFEPFPALVQVAPCSDLVVFDAEGDGGSDLFLVQNFFGPQRESGRMDGGLGVLLLGDGEGGFEPVWPDRSGLIIPGDARSASALDLDHDGRLDLIVGENDAPLRAFRGLGR